MITTKRQPTVNNNHRHIDSSDSSASNQKSNNRHHHKTMSHKQQQLCSNNRTIAPLLETINALAINSENSSDESSAQSEYETSRDGRRMSTTSRRNRNRRSRGKSFGSCIRESLVDDDNDHDDDIGEVDDENRADQKCHETPDCNIKDQIIGNDGNSYNCGTVAKSREGNKVEDNHVVVVEDDEDDEDNQYFSEDYDFGANANSEPLPLAAMLRMSMQTNLSIGNDNQLDNGQQLEPQQQQLFHQDDSPIGTTRNNLLDSSHKHHYHQEMVQNSQSPKSASSSSNLFQSDQSRHNHRNNFSITTENNKFSSNHHHNRNSYRQPINNGGGPSSSNNKSGPIGSPTTTTNGTKCVRFNCDVQVTSVSPRMTPKFSQNLNGTCSNNNNNHNQLFLNLSTGGATVDLDDNNTDTGSNTYDEVASLSNIPINSMSNLSNPKDGTSQNCPNSRQPIVGFRDFSLSSSPSSVQISNAASASGAKQPKNSKKSKKFPKISNKSSNAGQSSMSASSSATSVSDSEHPLQKGPMHLYANVDQGSNEQQQQQLTTTIHPYNFSTQTGPQNLQVNHQQQNHHHHQQQQKSILKDPLCAKLRSAIRRGQFSIAETAKLESEIDSLLYGGELQQQSKKKKTKTKKKTMNLNGDIDDSGDDDENVDEDGGGDDDENDDVEVDEEIINGTVGGSNLQSSPLIETNNKSASSSSMMIPFHHHVNHLHSRNSNPHQPQPQQSRDISGQFLTPNELGILDLDRILLFDSQQYSQKKIFSKNIQQQKDRFGDSLQGPPPVSSVGPGPCSGPPIIGKPPPVVDIAAAAIQCNSYIQMIEEKYRHKVSQDILTTSQTQALGTLGPATPPSQQKQSISSSIPNKSTNNLSSTLKNQNSSSSSTNSKGHLKSHVKSNQQSRRQMGSTPTNGAGPNGSSPGSKFHKGHFLPSFSTGIDQLMSNLLLESQQRGGQQQQSNKNQNKSELGLTTDSVIGGLGLGCPVTGPSKNHKTPTTTRVSTVNNHAPAASTPNDKLYSMFADPVKGPSINILMDELSRSFYHQQQQQPQSGPASLSDTESIKSDSNHSAMSKSLAENHIYEEILYECLEQQQNFDQQQLGPAFHSTFHAGPSSNNFGQMDPTTSMNIIDSRQLVSAQNTFAQPQPLETTVTISNHTLI